MENGKKGGELALVFGCLVFFFPGTVHTVIPLFRVSLDMMKYDSYVLIYGRYYVGSPMDGPKGWKKNKNKNNLKNIIRCIWSTLNLPFYVLGCLVCLVFFIGFLFGFELLGVNTADIFTPACDPSTATTSRILLNLFTSISFRIEIDSPNSYKVHRNNTVPRHTLWASSLMRGIL